VKYSNDIGLTDATFFLKNSTPESLTAMFVNEYIVSSGSGGTVGSLGTLGTLDQVSWKNMMYLWKHFLESRRLSSVIAQTKLRNTLIILLDQHYSEDDDCFIGISSKYLPTVNKFLQFWNENMVYDETEPEIEIGEIATLFRQNTNTSINETQIVNLLTHFFPDLEIDQGKYIYRMRSKVWDKQVDIMMAMENLRDKVSVYDSYVHYCNYMNGTIGTSSNKRRSSSGSLTTPLLVSKQYFEKYMALNVR